MGLLRALATGFLAFAEEAERTRGGRTAKSEPLVCTLCGIKHALPYNPSAPPVSWVVYE